jgi:hypothetical protein
LAAYAIGPPERLGCSSDAGADALLVMPSKVFSARMRYGSRHRVVKTFFILTKSTS